MLFLPSCFPIFLLFVSLSKFLTQEKLCYCIPGTDGIPYFYSLSNHSLCIENNDKVRAWLELDGTRLVQEGDNCIDISQFSWDGPVQYRIFLRFQLFCF